jgi:hypothetical protein
MDPKVLALLQKEQAPPLAATMLDRCVKLVNFSRQRMSAYYQGWDDSDDIYHGRRPMDKSDIKAKERDEPTKMIVPAAYAQVQTFVSFCIQLFTQRDRLFELIGIGPDDHEAAKVAEAFIARDLEYNDFTNRLYSFLKCIGCYGVGIIKSSWITEKQRVRGQQAGVLANTTGMTPDAHVVKYQGNKITVVSPYTFFPDVRLPMARFQEGEFVASEELVTDTALKVMQADGLVAGVEFIPEMNDSVFRERGSTRVHGLRDPATGQWQAPSSLKAVKIVTEVEWTIIPSEFMLDDDTPLGPENYPCKYLIWYANDQRIIRIEKLDYLHDQYTYDVAQFDPDEQAHLSESLQAVIGFLQNALTWFINSRVTNVRKVIGNRLVVDPAGIMMKDLENRNPVIRLTASAARQGIDRYIKQLDVQDATTNHVKDADVLFQWIQVATGINDNALGQFHTGRRSAQEARTVATAAAARLKMVATLIFNSALKPLARKMLSNLRDGLEVEQVVRLVGLDQASRGATFKKASRDQLVGEYDFEFFDGTLPSERSVTATFLEEVLKTLLGNPTAAIALQIDPKELLRESFQLRGIRNPERFMLPPPPPLPQQPGGGIPDNMSPTAPASPGAVNSFPNGLEQLY